MKTTQASSDFYNALLDIPDEDCEDIANYDIIDDKEEDEENGDAL